jgi:hypothetical protein
MSTPYHFEPYRFINHYEHCGVLWNDESDSMNNDRCPECDKEIEPFESEDFGPDDDDEDEEIAQ